MEEVNAAIFSFISLMGRSSGSFSALIDSVGLPEPDLEGDGGSIEIIGDLSPNEDSGKECELPEWESESNGFDGLSSPVRDGGFRVSK